jgi:hypothetical protein
MKFLIDWVFNNIQFANYNEFHDIISICLDFGDSSMYNSFLIKFKNYCAEYDDDKKYYNEVYGYDKL